METITKDTKIGVFDSGAGGKSVGFAIKEALPEYHVIYAEDKEHVPYGTKTPAEMLALVRPRIQWLIDQGCKVIVIACNSVTTTIIGYLRAEYKVPIIGIEPMIKTASERTKSKVIAVCATPATLNSKRYKQLLEKNAAHLTVLEPDCSQWAYMIEQNKIDDTTIRSAITEVCEKGADTIVLACTHYHWIERYIKQLAEKYGAEVIQPEEATIRQLKTVLAQLD